MSSCPLCDSRADLTSRDAGIQTRHLVECERCGRYEIFSRTLNNLKKPENIHLVIGMVREATELGGAPVRISNTTMKKLEAQAPIVFEDRARRLLHTLAHRSERGRWLSLSHWKDYPLAFCKRECDLDFDLHNLKVFEWIETRPGRLSFGKGRTTKCLILEKGWEQVEKMRRAKNGSKVFVSMWFDRRMKSAYLRGIAPAVRAAGYHAVRIDDKPFLGRIDDQILDEIREVRFLVADVTGHRGGVYYEAGYAHALRLPVVWSCRQDHLDQVHFNVRQYNFIVWETPAELREKLTERILETEGIGPGPLRDADRT